jgi:mRNA interferase RelE/StbE
LRPSARKDLDQLPHRARDRVIAGLGLLAQDPRGPNTKRLCGQLAGLRRLRVGDYRAVYDVDDKAQLVDVLRISKRGNAY